MMHLQRYYQTNFALGSDVTLTLVSDRDEAMVNELCVQLWRQIYRFEQQFSRFLPQSELSWFNRKAGLKYQISTEFRELLVASKQLAEQTNGLYNPFILPALQRAGYTKSFAKGYESDTHDDHSTKQVVSYKELIIGDTWAQIPFGTALDMGGCGKGFLADRLADSMPEWVHGYWISMGGDIAGAGFDETDKPWSVAISSALDPERDSSWAIQTTGERFGVATSGTAIRTGKKAGQTWHHIIDPRTLKPSSSDLILSTVLAPSAIDADVLASCAIILGSMESKKFLKHNGATAALLQGVDTLGNLVESTFGKHLIMKAEAIYA